ncbi:RagB/SusD family nutrient uptake outer membrane protein [Pedobacter sp. PLR]|uniref:RagB/SusD family nutrient uptake outer membrane protein n=1 Tax=Pedobacter sp. PLR TaxID=2994465 RepID=UPI002245F5D1|nr:RagB/SusD family nutrient uptake outer membrane protein [Pedobacter sp. PLR]MCX2450107.1 RagB/SusD family nutrient uptake outer membrane protein [Pedobacter sp. PLR]
MKTRHYIIVLFFGGCLLSSLPACKKALDITQESEISSNSMWKSQGDAEAAVNGVYVQLRAALGANYANWGDYRSGLYGPGKIADVGQVNIFNNTIFRDNEGTDWTLLYTTINNCNLILKYTPGISFSSDDRKNEVLANAYFVRALCYFQIARIWGDAPVVTSGFESDKQEDLLPSRKPALEVFAQVEMDVNQAVNLMPPGVNKKKKASKGSVNMLKADYYLWKAKRLNGGNSALEVANKAIDEVFNSGYSLSPLFSSVFGVANESGPEIIFSVNLLRDEFTGGYPSLYLIPTQYVINKALIENPIKIGSAQQYISVTDAYENLIYANASDTRSKTSVMIYQEGTEKHRWINKLSGEWVNNTRFFSSDIIIYRLSEAYLMRAEILNALDKPQEAMIPLNRIAERAYGVPDFYPAGLSKTAIDNAIINETLKEFVAEGKSWWAFVRFGVAFQRVPGLIGKEAKTNILLWPITSASINNNPNIKQTEGFN